MQRYTDKLGYTLPVAHEAEIFADEGQITSGMKNAVQAMQQAGVMNGKAVTASVPRTPLPSCGASRELSLPPRRWRLGAE